MLYESITYREPIEKGWSGDKKYRVTTQSGQNCLLRISPSEYYDRRAAEFRRAQQAAGLGIPMCRPLEFGHCPEGVYTINSWIHGRDAQDVIPELVPEKQYTYGLNAGYILRRLHTLPAPPDAVDWEARFNRKIDQKITLYEASPMKYEGGEAFLAYIEGHRHLLQGRPQTYQHGDYHIGNMMIDEDGILTIIDFEKDDWGDPWEELNRIVWSAQASPLFASGMVDGYFPEGVPLEFWELLALYICSNTLGSLPWAVPYGEEEILTMLRQGAEILGWYNGMGSVVPSWYCKP